MNNTLKAVEYGIKLIGTPYDYWSGEEIQTGAPMFAENGAVPSQLDIISLNCAGLCNVMLRKIGKTLPYWVDTMGGTYAYARYYKDKAYKFNINNTYPFGTLLIRGYKDINDQGHLAVIIEEKGKDSLILQSHIEGDFLKSTIPGVNAMYTLEESNNSFKDEEGNGCYYQMVVLPEDWLE